MANPFSAVEFGLYCVCRVRFLYKGSARNYVPPCRRAEEAAEGAAAGGEHSEPDSPLL